jgi:hypothetical protein
MRADNQITNDNRIIRLTEIGGRYGESLDIVCNYPTDVESRCDSACLLDNDVIPKIVKLINDDGNKPTPGNLTNGQLMAKLSEGGLFYYNKHRGFIDSIRGVRHNEFLVTLLPFNGKRRKTITVNTVS